MGPRHAHRKSDIFKAGPLAFGRVTSFCHAWIRVAVFFLSPFSSSLGRSCAAPDRERRLRQVKCSEGARLQRGNSGVSGHPPGLSRLSRPEGLGKELGSGP